MGYEGALKLKVAHLVAAGVEVQKSVKTDALDRAEPCAQRGEGLQASAGAYAYYVECTVLRFLGAGLVVYVGQCVQLVDYYVNIVTADAGGLHGDALAFVQAGDGAELAVAYRTLNAVKQFGNQIHAAGITYKYYLIGQLLGFKVQVEAGTVIVYDKFGWCEVGTHRLIGLGN